MRNEVVDFLTKKIDSGSDNFVFLTGDLGYSVLEPLRTRLGNKFINVGIAESLMTTISAAFATYGFKAFTYSITPFATLRCLEQIRNDVCYHNADVTVVGIGAGFGYGPLGPTHHAIEDLAAVWSIPNISVYNPADLNEAYACFEHSWNQAGPKYLRLSKGGDGYLSRQDLKDLKDIKVVEYSQGTDLTIICAGNILTEVMKARSLFPRASIQVLSCPILKPFPEEELVHKISSKKVIIVEELSPYGGFSGQCSKAILKVKPELCSDVRYISAADVFSKIVGSSDFQRKNAGVSASAIEAQVKEVLGTRP
jgi:transketolase